MPPRAAAAANLRRPPDARGAPLRLAVVAAALLAGSLVLFWPGYAMFDTVAQYRQATGGVFDDWHPPVMSRLWSLFGARGTAPMLAGQLAFYWLGLALIAGRLGARWGLVALAIGIWPPFLGWMAAVLKDAQMAAAMLAAVGIVGWWRLAGRRVPVWAATAAAILLAYATLVRANAVFASVPLAVMLLPRPRPVPARLALWAGATVAVLAVSGPINRRLLGAVPTGVERTQALYDLAGIAVRAGPGARDTGMTADETDELIRRRCVRPFFWDPLGEPTRCDATVERLRALSPGDLYRTLATAALHHPAAYAAHRLAHLNSTERWWVPYRWPSAAPPQHGEANDEGLRSPSHQAAAFEALAGWCVETPLGWPVLWVAVALAGLADALRRAASPRRDLALALLGSALTLEASFAVISIASDLRYHLWPMVATALAAALLLAERRPTARGWRAAGAGVAIVVAVGLAARIVLPLPPQTYRAMLG